jgi:prevent-host-death family protein
MSKQVQYIGVGNFKAKCLGLMTLVHEQGNEIVITKRGKPIARVIPYSENIPSLSGYLKGSVKIKGDIVRTPEVHWNADE